MNLRKRVQVELITDARILGKRVDKPGFCKGYRITDCVTVAQCKVATLTMNRPINVGFSILELSKLHMYDFHYNHMCVKYSDPGQMRLLSTDTDSMAYAIQTDDIYRAEDAVSRYNFSEYPFDHPLYSATNRKALGFFKDELNSLPIKSSVVCVQNATFSSVRVR